MKKRIVFALPGNEMLAENITAGINGEKGDYVLKQFPDGESYVRILSDVKGRDIVVVCTLNDPNNKILPLMFLCKLLKDLNALSICVVIPYLAYMRQDKQFNSGEAITSEYFAKLLSSFADEIITIDPHLHRRTSMQEIYDVPCKVLHAAELISEWIKENIPDAVLIGPDSESKQWVSEVAKNAGVPYIILEKIRNGDKDVEVSAPQMIKYMECVPVLIDDIISTGHTMIETVLHLKKMKTKAPVCIGIHAVFAENAYNELLNSGAKMVLSGNTIMHGSNKIDVSKLIVEAFKY